MTQGGCGSWAVENIEKLAQSVFGDGGRKLGLPISTENCCPKRGIGNY